MSKESDFGIMVKKEQQKTGSKFLSLLELVFDF